VVKTVPPDNKVVISEVLAVTLLCKEDSSVSILEIVLNVPEEGISWMTNFIIKIN